MQTFVTATTATSQLTQASDICIATSLPPCVTQPQQLQGSGSSAVDTRNYSYDSQASFTSSMELWYEHPFIYNWWINTPTTYILLCIPLLHIIIIIMIWCAMNYVSLCIILSTMVYICYFKVSRHSMARGNSNFHFENSHLWMEYLKTRSFVKFLNHFTKLLKLD